ncbi:MAG: hypothetical protein J7K89_07910 [Candidatus Cloacimonetes bacterium]|nr:hypothetical protein [Candidatus Cloacimonadota bacterium]
MKRRTDIAHSESGMIRNQLGFSLTDLVASLPLAALVLVILTLAILSFVKTYQETKLYVQLQNELFQAVETMRYGFARENITGDPNMPDGQKKPLAGLLTAQTVEISTNQQSIRIEPVKMTSGSAFYSRFFVDPNGHLRVSGQSGINLFYTNELVFPSSLAKVGNEYKFRLLDARFTPQYASGNKVYVVGIYFKAQVRFRKRLKNQSVQEDIEQNTRTIEYKTSVFLGNADVN